MRAVTLASAAVLAAVCFLPHLLALPVSPSSPSGLADAIALFDAGRLAEARSAFGSLASAAGTRADATYWLGRCVLAEGEAGQAVDHIESAIALAPKRSDFHTWLGNAYFVQSESAGMFRKLSLARKMRSAWLEAVALDPGNSDARDHLVRFYIIAPGIAGGDRDEAWKHARELERHDPMRGLTARAFLHENAGEPEKAEAAYREAAERFEDNPKPLQQLGFYYQGRKDWAGAFRAFEGALEREPDDRTSLYQIGRTAVFSKTRLERGVECLEQYLTLHPGPNEPSHAWAHYRMGLIHGLAEKPEVARRAFRSALELDPGHADAKKALESL